MQLRYIYITYITVNHTNGPRNIYIKCYDSD